MSQSSRNFTPEQNANVAHTRIKDEVAISELASVLGIQPTQICQWLAIAMAQLEKSFKVKPGGAVDSGQKPGQFTGLAWDKFANSSSSNSRRMQLLHFLLAVGFVVLSSVGAHPGEASLRAERMAPRHDRSLEAGLKPDARNHHQSM